MTSWSALHASFGFLPTTLPGSRGALSMGRGSPTTLVGAQASSPKAAVAAAAAASAAATAMAASKQGEAHVSALGSILVTCSWGAC